MVWAMRPEVLEPLPRILVQIASTLPTGFVFQALWQGDSPNVELKVTTSKLQTWPVPVSWVLTPDIMSSVTTSHDTPMNLLPLQRRPTCRVESQERRHI